MGKITWSAAIAQVGRWDFDGPNTQPQQATRALESVAGAGVAVWTETITSGTLHAKLVSNMAALAETTWKYAPGHAPDNLYHAVYRLQYHLRKLQQAPYHVAGATPVYSGENLFRAFPQGCEIPEDKLSDLGENGEITQDFIDKHYPTWGITIRAPYAGLVNNNLMANINPEQAGAGALARCPLGARLVYSSMPQAGGNASEIYQRVNPWLAADLNTLLSPLHTHDPKLTRSNFASTSAYYAKSPFYMDQRDAPIELVTIRPPSTGTPSG